MFDVLALVALRKMYKSVYIIYVALNTVTYNPF